MVVLGIGQTTLEVVGYTSRFADAGAQRALERFSEQGAGAAATALVVLARWGVETRFLGRVGDDPRGAQIRHTLAGEGVDTRWLQTQPGAVSPMTLATVTHHGERVAYTTRGEVTSLRAEDVDDALLEGVGWLHVDGSEPEAQRAAIERARRLGEVRVSLDATGASGGEAALLDLVDVLISSERFACMITGEGSLEGMLRGLITRGVHLAVITLGDEGCAAMSADAPGLVLMSSALDVPVLDASGAGEVFQGALLHAILTEQPLTTCLHTANIAAGLSCTGLGARGHIPTREEVLVHLPGNTAR